MSTTSIEKTFARANVYRFLSLAFAYPAPDVHRELLAGIEAVRTAAEVIGGDVAALAPEATRRLESQDRRGLATDFRKTFTFSASPDCPLKECAYSAKHVYQEVQDLADIAGFYSAFGLEIAGERPDELSAELEFSGLLALKEGIARERGLKEQAKVCREGSRLFLREHLGRWAENIGRRIEVLAPGTAYAAFGGLLAAFAASEVETLKTGPVSRYQEVPNPPEPLDDEGCPAEAGLGSLASTLQEESLTELTPVGLNTRGGP